MIWQSISIAGASVKRNYIEHVYSTRWYIIICVTCVNSLYHYHRKVFTEYVLDTVACEQFINTHSDIVCLLFTSVYIVYLMMMRAQRQTSLHNSLTYNSLSLRILLDSGLFSLNCPMHSLKLRRSLLKLAFCQKWKSPRTQPLIIWGVYVSSREGSFVYLYTVELCFYNWNGFPLKLLLVSKIS